MPREFSRSVRVAAQLQRELADLVRTEVRDPRIGMVTISEVEVTRDLAVAKVYVTFLGSEQPVPKALALLGERAPMLRHELGRRMRLRVMPDLRFVYDDSLERGMRMDALLDHLGETAGDSEPE